MSTRLIVVAIVALAVGGSAGAIAMYGKYNGYIGALEDRVGAAQDAQKALQNRTAELEKQLAAAESRRKLLETQMAGMSARQAPSSGHVDTGGDSFEAVGEAPGGDNRLAEMLAGQAALMQLDRERARDEERDQERDERREEFRTRMREGMANHFQEALEATNDPTAQQYILAIEEQVNANMEMMRQWREIESEEDRDAFREQAREAWDQTRTMVRDYQDHLLSNSLAESGITDPASQQQVLTNLRATMESEHYGISGRGWGGRGGGWRGRGGDDD